MDTLPVSLLRPLLLASENVAVLGVCRAWNELLADQDDRMVLLRHWLRRRYDGPSLDADLPRACSCRRRLRLWDDIAAENAYAHYKHLADAICTARQAHGTSSCVVVHTCESELRDAVEVRACAGVSIAGLAPSRPLIKRAIRTTASKASRLLQDRTADDEFWSHFETRRCVLVIAYNPAIGRARVITGDTLENENHGPTPTTAKARRQSPVAELSTFVHAILEAENRRRLHASNKIANAYLARARHASECAKA